MINRNFLVTALTVLVPLIMQLIFIRYVSYNVNKVDYGNFVLIQTLISGLSYIFIQIPSQAYDRFFNQAENKVSFVNEFRTILIFINTISFFLILLYGVVMKKFEIDILIIVFIYFVLLNNYSFNQRVFLLEFKRNKYFLLRSIEAAAKFIAPLIAYYVYESLMGFLIGLVAGYFISFIVLMNLMQEYKFHIEYNINKIKQYFAFAYPIFFVSTLTWLISFSDRYFIEFLSNTEELAIYALLAQVAGMGQIAGQIYMMYVNPKLLKLFDSNNSKAIIYMQKMLKILFLSFIFLSIIIYFLPPSLYEILLEPQIINQKYYFMTFYILVIGIFCTVFQTAYSMYLNLYKKLHVLALIYIPAVILNLIGNFFIETYGIIAASISTLLAYMIILFGQFIYVRTQLLNI